MRFPLSKPRKCYRFAHTDYRSHRMVGEMSFRRTREKSTRGISLSLSLGMRRCMYIHRRLLHLEFRVSISAISLATLRIYSRSFTASSTKLNDKTKYVKIVGIFNPMLDLFNSRSLRVFLCTYESFEEFRSFFFSSDLIIVIQLISF